MFSSEAGVLLAAATGHRQGEGGKGRNNRSWRISRRVRIRWRRPRNWRIIDKIHKKKEDNRKKDNC